MATSRTGTSQYKKARKRRLHQAQAQGIDRCPYCTVTLDYDVSLKPNSAETDHVVAHAKGGQDHVDNLAVCCRRCNQSKGDRPAPKTATVLAVKPLKTSRRWRMSTGLWTTPDKAFPYPKPRNEGWGEDPPITPLRRPPAIAKNIPPSSPRWAPAWLSASLGASVTAALLACGAF